MQVRGAALGVKLVLLPASILWPGSLPPSSLDEGRRVAVGIGKWVELVPELPHKGCVCQRLGFGVCPLQVEGDLETIKISG